MEDARVQRLLSVFAAIGEIYQALYSNPTWDEYPEALSDRVQSLAVFLDGYAFERAGRAPRYSITAAKIVTQRQPENLDPQSVWNEFFEAFKRKDVNVKVNPLAPEGTEFRQKGVRHLTKGMSVIELDRTHDMPLVKWVVNELPNAPETVHSSLQKISGVGEKIASFFMRDVACRFNVFPLRAEDRRFLQPVDIWVERAATCLGAKDGSAAEFLVERSGADGNRPERVNQGIWLFGAEVVRSKTMLEGFLGPTNGKDRVMCDLKKRIALLREILNILESAPE
jgi:hypothetical protein